MNSEEEQEDNIKIRGIFQKTLKKMIQKIGLPKLIPKSTFNIPRRQRGGWPRQRGTRSVSIHFLVRPEFPTHQSFIDMR